MFLSRSPGAATAAAGKATLSNDAGIITTEALSTAAGATYTLTLGCAEADPSSVPFVQVSLGSATTGVPVVVDVTAGTGSLTIVVLNAHATAAFNGTLQINYLVIN